MLCMCTSFNSLFSTFHADRYRRWSHEKNEPEQPFNDCLEPLLSPLLLVSFIFASRSICILSRVSPLTDTCMSGALLFDESLSLPLSCEESTLLCEGRRFSNFSPSFFLLLLLPSLHVPSKR